MNLERALRVAKQMCNPTHPATIRSKTTTPDLRMIRVNNGQYLTSRGSGTKGVWSFEEFVAAHEPKP